MTNKDVQSINSAIFVLQNAFADFLIQLIVVVGLAYVILKLRDRFVKR